MKKFLKYFTYLGFAVLISANIVIFVKSMSLSQQINVFEKGTKRLKQENIELEKEAYRINSLQYVSSVAAELGFKKKAEPYFLENLGFALKQ